MFYEIVERVIRMEQAGRSVRKLHVGDTNLPTPPEAMQAAIAVINRARSTYGSAAGLFRLRERIAKREECAVENVVVGPGAKHLIYALLSVLCRDGARVAIPSPAWPAYLKILEQLRLTPHTVKTSLDERWNFAPEALTQATVAILCQPLNPTSTVYGKDCVEGALRHFGEKLIIDEAYRGLAFKPLPTILGAIRVRSFSKEFNLEGWRLGYAVAPPKLISEVVRFLQITTTCVPDFVQEAGLACLERETELLALHRETWKRRLGVASNALKAAGFRFADPDGGMYIFCTHERLKDGDAFAARLLDEGIAVAPGSAFGYPRFLRLCVNLEPEAWPQVIDGFSRALEGTTS